MLTVIFINSYIYWLAYNYGIKIENARQFFTQDEPHVGVLLALIGIFVVDMFTYFVGFFKILSWIF